MTSRMAVRTCVFVAAATLVGVWAGGCEPVFPSPDRFDQAPYQTIVDGRKPDFDAVPASIPLLKMGEKVAFFATAGGEIRPVYCLRELTIRPTVPQSGRALADLAASSGLALETGELALLSAEAQSGLRLAEEAAELRLSRERTGMETRVLAVAGRTERGRSGQETVAAGAPAREEVAPDSGEVTEKAQAQAMARAKTAGITQFRGQDSIALLFEGFTIPGFYGEDNILVLDDSAVIVAMAEREHIMSILKKAGPLADLINRPPSAQFRKDFKLPPKGVYTATVELKFAPAELYFGHEFALMISVTNTGSVPLFDTVILNELPENADFVKFTVNPAKTRGFFPHYLESDGRNLIFVKLYRPLLPKQTFRIPVILRAGPWRIDGPPVGKALAGKVPVRLGWPPAPRW